MRVANFRLKAKGGATSAHVNFDWCDHRNFQFISIGAVDLAVPMDLVAEKAMRILEIAVDNGMIEVDLEKPIKGIIEVDSMEAYFPVSFYLDPEGPTWIHAGVSQDRKNHLLSCGFKCMDPCCF